MKFVAYQNCRNRGHVTQLHWANTLCFVETCSLLLPSCSCSSRSGIEFWTYFHLSSSCGFYLKTMMADWEQTSNESVPPFCAMRWTFWVQLWFSSELTIRRHALQMLCVQWMSLQNFISAKHVSYWGLKFKTLCNLLKLSSKFIHSKPYHVCILLWSC